MEDREILRYIDHTCLQATATRQDIDKLVKEAILYECASVCIPPTYVKWVKEHYQNQVKICTVVSFPLGYADIPTKVLEAQRSILAGADEIDMVIHLGAVKNKDWEYVEEELVAMREATRGKVLKVIIECCYLSEEEKIKLCQLITKVGADYIKTSTGFGSGGARLEDIDLFKKYIGSQVKIKGAGGIRSLEQMKEFLAAGCHRIGTSSGILLYEKGMHQGY